MLFYCKLNSEKKTIKLMIKKFLQVMPRRFSNDLFALKKCRINLTSNKKIGYQTFNEHSADKLIVAYIFEYEIKN